MAQAIFLTLHLCTAVTAILVWLTYQHVFQEDKKLHGLMASLATLLHACRSLRPLASSYFGVLCTFFGWKLVSFAVVLNMFTLRFTSSTPLTSPPNSVLPHSQSIAMWLVLLNWSILLIFATSLALLFSPSGSIAKLGSALSALSGGYLNLMFWAKLLFFPPTTTTSTPSPIHSTLHRRRTSLTSPTPEDSSVTNASAFWGPLTTWVWCLPLIAFGACRCIEQWPISFLMSVFIMTGVSVGSATFRKTVNTACWLAWAGYKCAERGVIVSHFMDFRQGFMVVLRAILFVVPLLPGLLRVAWDYVVNPNIIHDVPYGNGPRHALDVYLPAKHSIAFSGKRPIVIMFSGGAWMIGYKAWVVLPASILASMGFLVISPDYPNFPEADAEAMTTACIMAVKWVMTSSQVRDQYQGDQSNVYVMGQSAGANFAATVVVRKAEHDLALLVPRTKTVVQDPLMDWGPHPVRGLVLIAGLYNIKEEIGAFNCKGVSDWALRGIFGEDPAPFSPKLIVEQHAPHIAQCMPPVLLSCGGADRTALPQFTHSFAKTLRGCGVPTDVIEVPGKSHTATFVEDPLDNTCTEDPFLSSAVAFMMKTIEPPLSNEAREALQQHTWAPNWWLFVPACVVKFARWVNPL